MDRLDDLIRDLRATDELPRDSASEAPSAAPRTRRPRSQPRLPRTGHSRLRRAVVVGLAVIALLLVVATILPDVGSEPASVPTRTPSAPIATPPGNLDAAPSDWSGIIRSLDARRARAFRAADPSLLAAVDVPGSPADRADRKRIAALQTEGVHARGFSTTLLAAREQSLTMDGPQRRAVVSVRDQRSAYDLVDEQESVVQHARARGKRQWIVRLAFDGDVGWRFVSATTR